MPKIVRFPLCLCLALLTLFAPAAAQDEPDYQLRNLSAQEFVENVLDEVLPENYFCPFDLNTSCHFPRMVAVEAMLRYDQLDVDFATLYQAYNEIVRNARWEEAAAKYWTEQVILAWLRQSNADLRATRHFKFARFDIQVTPFDANGDGQSEWLLDVDTGERGFQGLLPLMHDGETFRFLPTSLPVERPCCFAEHDIRSWGSVNLITVEDGNGDGRDEIVAFTGASSRYETDMRGRIFVLGLQNGAMVDLMAEPLTYTEPAYLTSRGPEPPYQTLSHWWRFNAASGQPEFVQTRQHIDNFECYSYQTRHFAWAAGKFTLTAADPIELKDTIGCALRQAQEAFWIGDFETALQYYDYMLTLPLPPDWREWMPDFHQQRRAYAVIRSALAQAQLGDLDAAQTSLEAARQESDDPQMIGLIDNLAATDNTAFALCQRAYHHFSDHPNTYWPIFVNALYEPPGGSYPPPTPLPEAAKAGCDLSLFVETALEQHPWTDGDNPMQHLESLDIQVLDTLEADLNGDASPDQTIWIAPGVDAFIFLSTPDKGYDMLRAAIPPPADTVTVFAQPLPDQNDQALVVIANQQYSDYYCADRDITLPVLEMWHLTGDGIEMRLQAPICDKQYQAADLFSPQNELHLGAQLVDRQPYETSPYHWDAIARVFRAPHMLVVTDDPSLIEQNLVDWHDYSGETFLAKLATKPAKEVLDNTNQRLENYPDDDATLYERAVLLDIMGDHEAALAAYAHLSEGVIEHWQWYRKLARLHLMDT